jgi:hypothetical protein
MTTEETGTDERQARLDWMRAEFPAAHQRRYETRRHALVKEVRLAEPTPVPEADSKANMATFQQHRHVAP